MGIQGRVLQLLDAAGKDHGKAIDIISSYQRLVYEEEMGRIYKVIGICNKGTKLRGFGTKLEKESEM